jgi:hypothetical protein
VKAQHMRCLCRKEKGSRATVGRSVGSVRETGLTYALWTFHGYVGENRGMFLDPGNEGSPEKNGQPAAAQDGRAARKLKRMVREDWPSAQTLVTWSRLRRHV